MLGESFKDLYNIAYIAQSVPVPLQHIHKPQSYSEGLGTPSSPMICTHRLAHGLSDSKFSAHQRCDLHESE